MGLPFIQWRYTYEKKYRLATLWNKPVAPNMGRCRERCG